MKTKKLKIISIVLALVFAIVPQSVFANSATVYVSPASGSVTLGSNITVQVRVNSGSNEIDSAQARINFNTSRLQYVGFSAGDFQQVATSTGSGWFEFAGAILGGSTSGDSRIFSVTFKSLKTGSASLSLSNVLLASAGSSLTTSVSGGNISVNEPASSGSSGGGSSTPAPAPSTPPSSSSNDTPDTKDEDDSDNTKKKEVKETNVEYSVRITDDQEQPLVNHPVELHSDPIKATTDSDGWAVFKSVEPGKHTLVFEVDGLVMRWPVEVGQPLELADEDSRLVKDEIKLPVRFAEQVGLSAEEEPSQMMLLLIGTPLIVLGASAVFMSARYYYTNRRSNTS